jgi:hypothetical protein
LFDRVLRRQHMKGAGQGVDFPGNRDPLFLHGLQKR